MTSKGARRITTGVSTSRATGTGFRPERVNIIMRRRIVGQFKCLTGFNQDRARGLIWIAQRQESLVGVQAAQP